MNLKGTLFKFRLTIYFLLIFYFLTCCTRTDNIQDRNYSGEIVLKIGNLEFTRYEFEKKWNNQINEPNRNGKENWISQYLSNSYIVADAYHKKYDTSGIVRLKKYYAQLNMCSLVGGYYWNKVVEPKLHFTSADVKSAYKKRDKVYYLDYFVFADRPTMLSALLDTTIKNKIEFSKIALECKEKDKIWIASEPLVCPYKYLGDFKEIIYGLKPGEITKPLYGPKYVYVIKLNRLVSQKLPPYRKVKDIIKKELRDCKVNNIINIKQKEILNHARILINDSICNEMLTEINKINQTEFDTTRHLIDNNNVLASFTIGNEKQQLTIGDFLNYYHFYPFLRPVINEKKGIYSAVEFLVLQKSNYEEASQLGVIKEKGFLIELKTYTDDYMVDEYYKKEIENYITVTEAEKQEYYQKNKQSFEQVSECSVCLFKFSDKQSLEESWQYLSDKFMCGNFNNLTDSAHVKGLISFLPNTIVKRNDKQYSTILTNAIFNNPVNQLFKLCLDFEGAYYAFYKIKEGEKTIKPFEEVNDILFHQVRMMKIHYLENKRVGELKQQYNITINKINDI